MAGKDKNRIKIEALDIKGPLNKALIELYEQETGKTAMSKGELTQAFKAWKQENKKLITELEEDKELLEKLYKKDAQGKVSFEKWLKYLKEFEDETGKNAVWDDKLTKQFKEWREDKQLLTIKTDDYVEVNLGRKRQKKEKKPAMKKIKELELETGVESKVNVNVLKEEKKKTTAKKTSTKSKVVKKKKETVKKTLLKKVKGKGVYIRTKVDKLLDLVKKEEKTIDELSIALSVEKDKIEDWSVDLQEEGLIELFYPTNILASPRIILKKELTEKEFLFSSGKLLDTYEVLADNVPMTIRILDKRTNVPTYEAVVPIVGWGTDALINQLITKISEEVDVTSEELLDPRMMELLKQRFLTKAQEKIKNKFPNTNEQIRNILSGIIVHRMYGLKEIELLMSDENLEEITINGSEQPIAVYHKRKGWCITNLKMSSEEEILNFASSIGRKVGKNISVMDPLMDAHLISGDRVQSTLFPISNSGNTITIRKFSKNPWTLTQYIDNKTLNAEVAALLWLCMQYELSVMVAGGTASGKTSCLNSLTALIPPDQRIISIEDIREISLPKTLHWNWVPLTVREGRVEGAGNISMLNLMVSSLRMRPDRIIVGEVRRKKEAQVLFEAIHTGHSVYTTVHADDAEQSYVRLVEEPISIPKAQLEGLHLIVVMFRDRRKGFRRILEVAEILPIPGDVGERDIELRILYRWSAKRDEWEALQTSERLLNEIAIHTGMSQEEIDTDLSNKKKVLDWMVKQKIFNIKEFGKIIGEYYRDEANLMSYVNKNKSPGALL